MIEPPGQPTGRSLLQRFRKPDEDFLARLRMLSRVVPLVIGFLASLAFISMLIVQLAEPGSASSEAVSSFLVLFRYLMIPAVLIPFVVLKTAEVFVLVKVRRKESRDTDKGS